MTLSALFDLHGQVALVTGGRGHLGYAIAEGLIEAGAHVYIASRDADGGKVAAEKMGEDRPNSATFIKANVASMVSVRDCVSQIVRETGRLDVLVNNAYFGAGDRFEDMSEADWLEGIDGSINGVFRCTQAVLPTMESQHSGSIINIASMYGIVSPNPEVYEDTPFGNPANYGSGKAAVIQFTRYAACYFGRKGIRVNAVSPGPFPNADVQENEKFISRLAQKTPLGRIGDPDELKGVVVFLASQASSYITGENIRVDGGWTAW